MLKYFAFLQLLILLTLTACMNTPVKESNEQYPLYQGGDLGVIYTPKATAFKIWAPTASEVILRLYEKGDGGEAIMTEKLVKAENGTWAKLLKGDHKDKYYTFQVKIGDQLMAEVTDPYAKAVGVNGQRGMVIDLAATNPEGWENEVKPPLKGFEDIIIYELHVRDLSLHPESGIKNKGKFLGLTELGTKNGSGLATGLDHIKALGVTHIHLLPSFDFRSVDESKLEENNFNWGYDPQNYNVPEGSYSTDPYDGNVRVKEFKQLVKTLHENGLRVIMDVVYNHTGHTEESNFNQLVPKYYYRLNEEGGFSDGASCGNEIASDSPMVRKFMLESIKYWIEEYHIDGFRFDLMGLHDVETMNEISKMAESIDPTIFLYGEGWRAGATPLKEENAAIKVNVNKLYRVAVFSDDIRDGVKGHVFTADQGGFIQGNSGLKESVKFGIVASTQHPQINYQKVNYSDSAWAAHPLQTITYTSCHDNNTLFDKIALTNPNDSEEDRKKMHLLGITIILTSQGVPFLHAGSEMYRTKNGVENSYKSPDSINQIDWSQKIKHTDAITYIEGLIKLRKAHPAFKMTTSDQIQKHLTFFDDTSENVIAFQLKNHANGDEWKNIVVAYNASKENVDIPLDKGNWKVIAKNNEVFLDNPAALNASTITIAPLTAMILAEN